MNQVPVSTRSPMAIAASSSVVQIEAVRPKSLSFMSATASSSEATFMIPATGPKDSSVMTPMEWSTSIRIWGAR